MYNCKKCKAEFMSPLIERLRGAKRCDTHKVELLCPVCGSDNIDYIKPQYCYCGFCGQRIAAGANYCSDSCKRLARKYELLEQERKKKIADFEISKAIKEVDTYNKTHNTDYSYGKYFALKGLGGLDDGK